jgi:tRNA threonylcarbamoyladenosine biosynthesis protein TsaE
MENGERSLTQAMNTRFFDSESPQATREIGISLAGELKKGDILLLSGELGAGKTCLVGGIAQGLGCTSETGSPTFTLINEYRGGRMPLYHVDLYRIQGQDQIEGLGLDEYFDGEGVCAVEWSEHLGGLKPQGAKEITFKRTAEQSRRISMVWP